MWKVTGFEQMGYVSVASGHREFRCCNQAQEYLYCSEPANGSTENKYRREIYE